MRRKRCSAPGVVKYSIFLNAQIPFDLFLMQTIEGLPPDANQKVRHRTSSVAQVVMNKIAFLVREPTPQTTQADARQHFVRVSQSLTAAKFHILPAGLIRKNLNLGVSGVSLDVVSAWRLSTRVPKSVNHHSGCPSLRCASHRRLHQAFLLAFSGRWAAAHACFWYLKHQPYSKRPVSEFPQFLLGGSRAPLRPSRRYPRAAPVSFRLDLALDPVRQRIVTIGQPRYRPVPEESSPKTASPSLSPFGLHSTSRLPMTPSADA